MKIFSVNFLFNRLRPGQNCWEREERFRTITICLDEDLTPRLIELIEKVSIPVKKKRYIAVTT